MNAERGANTFRRGRDREVRMAGDIARRMDPGNRRFLAAVDVDVAVIVECARQPLCDVAARPRAEMEEQPVDFDAAAIVRGEV